MSKTVIRFRPDEDGLFTDETEFDTQNEDDLKELWFDFCQENDIITSVTCEVSIEFATKDGSFDTLDYSDDVDLVAAADVWWCHCDCIGFFEVECSEEED